METAWQAAFILVSLHLRCPHAESLTRDNFLEGPANNAGLALVDSWPDWPTGPYCWPDGRSGKSHSPRFGPRKRGRARQPQRALTAAAVPGALATGALVIEDLKSSDFDERALFSSYEPGAGRRGVRY